MYIFRFKSLASSGKKKLCEHYVASLLLMRWLILGAVVGASFGCQESSTTTMEGLLRQQVDGHEFASQCQYRYVWSKEGVY